MESLLLSINTQDPFWIAIAFVCGLAVKLLGLPPLIGFLIAGFLLHAVGAESGEFLRETADLGVTLLLFTIGLKLRLKSLARGEVWGVASIHMIVVTGLLALFALLLARLQLPLFNGIDLAAALMIGFALSFSSTVFAVKVLETLGASASRHGRISIGVLIIQDIAAVAFIAISAGKLPSVWALALLLLIPLRHLLQRLLDYTGHGELLVLYGIVLALGGADLFEMVGMKADLGALVFGMLLTRHPKSDELAKALMGFKDIFLVGFFLSVGMTAMPGWMELVAALVLLAFLPFKVALYFGLFSLFKLRARAAWQSSLNLANYSEFGLIVGTIAAASGLLPREWLAVFAIALAISFTLSAPLATSGDTMYARWRERIKIFERKNRLTDDADLDAEAVEVVVIGMGRLGSAAYDAFAETFPGRVLGVDLDEQNIRRHQAAGRFIVMADGTNPDLWSRASGLPQRLKWAVLCLPNHRANIAAATRLIEYDAKCRIAATSKFSDEVEALQRHGVEFVFNIYAEAGAGFANDLRRRFGPV
ncbi:MAG: potassium transporter Kef [Candidatus Sedimenticola endophacoides]|uniref:Potassium transporter Kef n=1 Tax=Candidatus Sedimenticola endophacoides TaxID=2548426 RepID=A0A657PZA0_9GAMM|nr:MAG: potassium transporter Kef [Candidatus Sedimenticola endophacoides]OQX36822.1 MAG: potassium transporter Kef [Candidatus Sedimenticola endophacoides]OQX39575.1 MAG: potassium transporter Kef [Candidatus Sedimenticola endophacoides]OQX41878.1 MAG: potassium transporter Kef [Candidatus Sedimenticola endophacoides]OQX45384.1 MAG: potassium transporter Kef [Candidatus Sedimenticola endophacoides]